MQTLSPAAILPVKEKVMLESFECDHQKLKPERRCAFIRVDDSWTTCGPNNQTFDDDLSTNNFIVFGSTDNMAIHDDDTDHSLCNDVFDHCTAKRMVGTMALTKVVIQLRGADERTASGLMMWLHTPQCSSWIKRELIVLMPEIDDDLVPHSSRKNHRAILKDATIFRCVDFDSDVVEREEQLIANQAIP